MIAVARPCATGLAIAFASFVFAIPPTPARAEPPPADFYGVNSGVRLLSDGAARPAAFAAMRAGGLSYVRVDASWGGVEPAPPVAGAHTFRWTIYDAFVADLARAGLRWYPMVGYSAEWAASTPGDPFSPPRDDADFAAFAAALARRYGSGGRFWSERPDLPRLPTTAYGIWNEPSNDMFWRGPAATPARYMRLYLAARAAIKAVDPDARVATAGLLDSAGIDGNAYLRAMLASAPESRGQIDAVGWHPYIGDVDLVMSSIWRARTSLTEAGLADVPIEVSEVGWHTGVPDSWRTAWMRGLATRLPHANMNVTRLMPYVWSDDPVWGMTNPDGTLAPLGSAYIAGIRDAQSPDAYPSAVTTAPGAERRAPSACRVRRRSATQRVGAPKNCLPRQRGAHKSAKRRG